MTPQPDNLGDVLLRLRPLPDAIPATVRLRRALKLLLRSFGLKCTSISPAGSESPESTRQERITDHRTDPIDRKDYPC